MKQKRGFKRSERVGQQLHQFIAGLLLTEFEDPRLIDVQVTHVKITPNLRHAVVYYVLFDSRTEDPEVQKALDKITGQVRREIGAQLHLKFVPDLVFKYDESIERGRRIDDLLSNLD